MLSQQISMEAGKNISSFSYKNSQGINLENLQSTNNTFMNLGYRRSIFTERFFLNAKAVYNSYGATGSDRILDNYYEWNVTYIGPSFGVEYEIAHAGDFIFSLKVDASAEFLIQGTQTINNQVYNLFDEDDFDAAIYFLRGGANIQYKVSNKISIFTEYEYGQSGSITSTTGDLTINAHNFGLGLLINVSKNIPSQTSVDTVQLNELKLEIEKNSLKIKKLEDDTAELEILEQKNVEKQQELQTLKTSIAEALQPYQGNDLVVKDVNGIVYIILENDMLFKSGSWKINSKGEETIIALAEVLAENADLKIQVEGHTDNKAFKENKMSNWELSTKRASTIVQILSQNENINPKNLTASGRGEFNPIADNETEEGRATNRRIEMIISPDLDEIAKIINE
jgi:flagellar motor protein MotB